jgi:hypothetical protein
VEITHTGRMDSVPASPVPASVHGMPEDATSPMRPRRLLSPLEPVSEAEWGAWGASRSGRTPFFFNDPPLS